MQLAKPGQDDPATAHQGPSCHESGTLVGERQRQPSCSFLSEGAASMPLRLLAPLLLTVLTISCAVVSTQVLCWSRMLHEN